MAFSSGIYLLNNQKHAMALYNIFVIED